MLEKFDKPIGLSVGIEIGEGYKVWYVLYANNKEVSRVPVQPLPKPD